MTTFEVKIETAVYGGDGLGRLADGRAIFVPFVIPGELARVRVIEEKAHFTRGEVVEVLEPSPLRVDARCSHFMLCGGCHYQHINYSAQLAVKAKILQEQLLRIGGLKDTPPVEVVSTPEPWYYRNQVQFHLTQEGKLGYQKAHSRQTFAIRECHLPEPPINQLWPQIDIEPIVGLERVIIRAGLDGELMLIVQCTDPLALDFNIEDLPVSIVQQGSAGSLVLAGSDHITMGVFGKEFTVSASSFFQVNTTIAEALVSHLLANVPVDETATALDVYCGVGLFSAFLAPKVKQLVGIENSSQSCEDYSTNLDEFDHVSLYEDTAEAVLTRINFHPDVIVVDPSREGLGLKTITGILAQGATHLAYVSCDPATLSRDAKHLISGGYTLEKLALFDMFPQTYHLESLSYWNKS